MIGADFSKITSASQCLSEHHGFDSVMGFFGPDCNQLQPKAARAMGPWEGRDLPARASSTSQREASLRVLLQ